MKLTIRPAAVIRRLSQMGAALLLAGCIGSPAPLPVPYTVTMKPGLAYGPLPAERGDLYRPQGVPAPPVVLVIHGGGWVAGDRTSAAGLARILASQGLAAFNIDYRLADAAIPDTRWPAQIVDAQLAIRWLRANAAALGIDGARIGAAGDSAGAQLALLLGTLHQVVPGDQAGLWPGHPSDVRAVADQFGPTDIAGLPGWMLGTYPSLFGTQTPAPALVAQMSPLTAVTPGSAPVLIIQGDGDVVVPPGQAAALQAALRSQHVAVEFVRYPGGHGYERLGGPAITALQMQIAAWLKNRLQH